MECPDFGLCVSQGCGVFPGTVAGTVSLPFDVVLEFRSIASSSQLDDARVGDCFDFVLFFAICNCLLVLYPSSVKSTGSAFGQGSEDIPVGTPHCDPGQPKNLTSS